MKTIAVDTGGTFTDMVVLDHDSGEIRIAKLSSTPADPGQSIVDCLRELTGGPAGSADVASLSHGTTVGTNLLLTGRGAKVGLFVTEGFGGINDVWHLPGQDDTTTESGIYVEKKPPVPPRLRREAPERVNANGDVVRALDADAVREAVRQLGRRGVESFAVVLLFSFLNTAHEREIEAIIRSELPGHSVSLSSRILPQVRERPRLSTTVANAYIAPVMTSYLESLEDRIRAEGIATEALYVMQSNGGVARVGGVVPVTTVLSGPCAGALAGMQIAAAAGYDNVVSLDMGGTSTDISLGRAGRILETTEGRIGDWEVAVPMLMINTIGAGGGTIASADSGGSLRVGPESAGADPGPVCYGKGGEEPTVTDANLVLGLLNPDGMLGGRVRLDHDGALRAVTELGNKLGLDPLRMSEGIVQVINAKMEEGVRTISTELGYDLREFAMVAFGGAGPLPAGRLAADLGMAKVIVPPLPGVTSALGLLMAEPRRDYVRSRLRLLSDLTDAELGAVFTELRTEAVDEFGPEGFSADDLRMEYAVDIQYLGQGYELTVPVVLDSPASQPDVRAIRAEFDEQHHRMFGHAAPDEQAEAVNYRARATVSTPRAEAKARPSATGSVDDARTGERPVCFDATKGMAPCPIYDRGKLAPGHRIAGPAIVEQLDSTTVVYPGQIAEVDDFLNIVLTAAIQEAS
jgi:N-methylhydantoinase A